MEDVVETTTVLESEVTGNLLVKHLTVTLQAHHVAIQPSRTVRTSLDSIGSVALLAQATALSTSRGETTHFTVLVNRITDPVNTRVVANLLVRGINKDDLVVLLCGILIDPVGIQYT